MIRLAKVDDMKQLLRMGKAFFDVSGYGQITDFSYSDTEIVLLSLIEQESLLIDGSGGMIGFLVFPMFMNSSYKLSQELFWWVDEDKRKTKLGVELLKAAEVQSKKLGADSMIMLSINDLNGDKVNNLYESLGYKRQEQTYMRTL